MSGIWNLGGQDVMLIPGSGTEYMASISGQCRIVLLVCQQGKNEVGRGLDDVT